MKSLLKIVLGLCALFLLGFSLSSCPGRDYTPKQGAGTVEVKQPGKEKQETPEQKGDTALPGTSEEKEENVFEGDE